MKQDEIAWKTSDWIIQEIGLAIGKQLDLILLVEIGLREPGGLQGNIEYIPFDRTHPELSFPKILEMISALLPRVAPPAEITAHPATPTAKAEQPEPETFEDVFKTPRPDWTRVHYEIGFMSALADGDREGADKIEAAYLATEDATQPNNRATWKAFAEYRRIVSGAGGALSTLEATAAENQNSSEIAEYLAWTYRYYGDESKAANAYELAAKHAIGDSEKVRLMGRQPPLTSELDKQRPPTKFFVN